MRPGWWRSTSIGTWGFRVSSPSDRGSVTRTPPLPSAMIVGGIAAGHHAGDSVEGLWHGQTVSPVYRARHPRHALPRLGLGDGPPSARVALSRPPTERVLSALAYNLLRVETERIADEAHVAPTRIRFVAPIRLTCGDWLWCVFAVQEPSLPGCVTFAPR